MLYRLDDKLPALSPEVARRSIAVTFGVFLAVFPLASGAGAQDPDPVDHDGQHANQTVTSPGPAWTWTTDGTVFFGYNYQQRHFADFSAWESQNWFMLDGQRRLGPGRLAVTGMVSLEPLTIQAGGSPQLFQTGESYLAEAPGGALRTPLVNDQHPHDLVMAAGATYRVERSRAAYFVGADLVGSPALGPTPFMHRDSARDNPQVPLTHHYLDSTHVTPGVLRAGLDIGWWTVEASAFRGEEPDEHRLDIDQPRLNSWSARVGWRRGPWQAQISGGHLHEPEWFEPYDVTRLTASIGFDGAVGATALAATLAWGENRQAVVVNGVSDGFLLEWDLRATSATSLYGRAEVTEKELFGLGLHPKGFAHPHVYSHVDALTLGLVRDLVTARSGRIGVGADLTMYHMSPDLLEFYAGSHSYHVFLRWRAGGAAQHRH
jgi:hypothetical protein